MQARTRGESVLRIEPHHPQVLVHAYRGGPLARLRHDHVIVARHIQGYVLLTDACAATGRADLDLRLDTLEVDGVTERTAAGFTTSSFASDIARTHRNMPEAVLEARRYSFSLLRIRAVPGSGPVLDVELSLHGVTRRIAVPAAIEARGKLLVANGKFLRGKLILALRPIRCSAARFMRRTDSMCAFESKPAALRTEIAAGLSLVSHMRFVY